MLNIIKTILKPRRFRKTFTQFVRHSSVRVRFAPSPTGYLHLGGLRTALYNHLFAISQGGATILRIEDTDQERKISGAEEQLVEDLAWCGIKYDEGPIRQSDRLALYHERVGQLIENGAAYRCFCTSTRLDILRREAVKAGQIPRYDNRCRSLDSNTLSEKLEKKIQFCVRFKLTPCSEPFKDLVYGDIFQDVAALEGDPVILKSDGFPTYHLANVVDDHEMGITHVLRGVEWQSSTKKHLLLYRAFQWEPPQFGHLPLLLNPDGTKLSKRQGDVDIRQYRARNIFPLAVVNFVVRAGGGFDLDKATLDSRSFTIEELAEKFDLTKMKGSSYKADLEKLKDCNRLELKRKLSRKEEIPDLVNRMRDIVTAHLPSGELNLNLSEEYIVQMLRFAEDRIYNLEELVSPNWKFVWVTPGKLNLTEQERKILSSIRSKVMLVAFTKEKLNLLCKSHAEEQNVKYPLLMKLLRSVLSGLKEGPGVPDLMIFLGKETVLARLDSATNEET